MPLLRTEQVHHLRKHGDFLILRDGLFRREVLRTVGDWLVGVACTLGLAVGFLLLATAALLAYGVWLGGANDGGDVWTVVHDGRWPGWGQAFADVLPDPQSAAVSGGGGVAVALVLAGALLFLFRHFDEADAPTAGTPKDLAERRWLKAFGGLTLLGVVLAVYLGTAVLVGLILVIGWWRGAGAPAGGAVVALVLSRLFARRGGDPKEARGLRDRLRAVTPQGIMAVAVPVPFVSAVVLCASIAVEAEGYRLWVPGGLAGAGAIVAAVFSFVNFNEDGPGEPLRRRPHGREHRPLSASPAAVQGHHRLGRGARPRVRLHLADHRDPADLHGRERLRRHRPRADSPAPRGHRNTVPHGRGPDSISRLPRRPRRRRQ